MEEKRKVGIQKHTKKEANKLQKELQSKRITPKKDIETKTHMEVLNLNPNDLPNLLQDLAHPLKFYYFSSSKCPIKWQ